MNVRPFVKNKEERVRDVITDRLTVHPGSYAPLVLRRCFPVVFFCRALASVCLLLMDCGRATPDGELVRRLQSFFTDCMNVTKRDMDQIPATSACLMIGITLTPTTEETSYA